MLLYLWSSRLKQRSRKTLSLQDRRFYSLTTSWLLEASSAAIVFTLSRVHFKYSSWRKLPSACVLRGNCWHWRHDSGGHRCFPALATLLSHAPHVVYWPPPTRVSHDGISHDVSHDDISQFYISHDGVSHDGVSQFDISHDDVSQFDLSHNDIPYDISHEGVSYDGISQFDVSHESRQSVV